LLGGFEVRLGGEPVTTFRSDKERALLAYLAIESQRPQRREELAGLLWGDLPEEAALNNLRKALFHLRQVLDDSEAATPCLTVTSKTIQFNPASDQSLDVAEFAKVTADAQGHRHRRAETCLPCRAWYERAANLYKGDLLQGFNLPDAIAFDEWLLVKREQLRQQGLNALQHLSETYMRRGGFGLAQHYARQQVLLEPWREIAHRQLMTVLARSGQRAAALAQYEACRKALQTELGVEPEAATVALYEKIKRGEAWEAGPTLTLNLPAQTTPFFARTADLDRLRGWLQNPDCRLLTLTGPGGVGKTRLALETVSDLGYEFADGVHFVPLAALRDPNLVADAIAQALGLKEQGSQPALENLKAYLRGKEILILLDNFEHLLDGAAMLAELLAHCPHLSLLVTSREPLRLRGEQLYPVLPLELPPLAESEAPSAPEDLLKFGAVGLFVQRSQAVQPDFALTGEDARAVVAVCRRLDGLPLAIELAAARVGSLSLAEMVVQLGRTASSTLQLLTEGARDMPVRQQTMRAAIGWSYELLEPEEQTLFRRLGVFLGGSGLAAIEALWAGQASPLGPTLESLVDKNLIQKTGVEAEARYSLLETIREFAWDALTRAEELAEQRRSHALYFVRVAEQSDSELTGPNQNDWLSRLDYDHDNVRAALSWALDNSETELALRLSGNIWRYWDMRGHMTEGRRWLERALSGTGEVKPAVRAKASNGAGMLIWYQGEYDLAGARMTEALEIWRALDDKFGMAVALNNLGMVAWSKGDYESALQQYDECLKMDIANDDKMGQAYSYGNLGLVYHHQGRFAEARASFEQSLAIFRELNNDRHAAFAMHNLGMVVYHQNDYAGARTLFEDSLRLKEELGDKWGIATTLVYLGNVTRAEGKLTHTRDLLIRSLHLRQELGDKYGLADTLDGLAALAAVEGDAPRAARLFGAAERLRRDSGTILHATDRLERDRNLKIAQAKLDEAKFKTLWAEGEGLGVEAAVKYGEEVK